MGSTRFLHSFRETEHGVVVRDRVEYSVPGGALIHTLFVRRDLERIFEQRRESLASLLPDG
jgi:ligand-binding SRPBCC domain-containing protein